MDVVVRGELCMHDAGTVRTAVTTLLNRGDVTAVNVDLTGLTLLDPAGAGVLVVAHRIAVNLRVALRLRAISAAAAEAMKLVGGADLLPGRHPIFKVLVRSSRRHGRARGTCPHGRRRQGREWHRTVRCGVLRPRGCPCRAGRPRREQAAHRRRAPADLSGRS